MNSTQHTQNTRHTGHARQAVEIDGLVKVGQVVPIVLDTAGDVQDGVLLPARADDRFRRGSAPSASAFSAARAEFVALLRSHILEELNNCPSSGGAMDEIDCEIYLEAASKRIRTPEELTAVRKAIRRLDWRPRESGFVALLDRVTGNGKRSEIDDLPPGERQAYQAYKGPYEDDAERSGQKLIPGKSYRAYIDEILKKNGARAKKSGATEQQAEEAGTK